MEVTGLQKRGEGPGRRSCCLMPAKPLQLPEGEDGALSLSHITTVHPILQEKGPLGLFPLKTGLTFQPNLLPPASPGALCF